jgi:hypothetical protein
MTRLQEHFCIASFDVGVCSMRWTDITLYLSELVIRIPRCETLLLGFQTQQTFLIVVSSLWWATKRNVFSRSDTLSAPSFLGDTRVTALDWGVLREEMFPALVFQLKNSAYRGYPLTSDFDVIFYIECVSSKLSLNLSLNLLHVPTYIVTFSHKTPDQE